MESAMAGEHDRDLGRFEAQLQRLHEDISELRVDVKALLAWRSWILGASAAVSAGVAWLPKMLGLVGSK